MKEDRASLLWQGKKLITGARVGREWSMQGEAEEEDRCVKDAVVTGATPYQPPEVNTYRQSIVHFGLGRQRTVSTFLTLIFMPRESRFTYTSCETRMSRKEGVRHAGGPSSTTMVNYSDTLPLLLSLHHNLPATCS